MLVNGDKLVVKKEVANFLPEGDTVMIVDVNECGMIAFAFGENFVHKGLMNATEFEEYFEKVEETFIEAPTVDPELIADIINHSTFTVNTVHNKCTVVTCKLPNGFVIVESSSCVCPENYDEDYGVNECLGRIEDKIWELEAYRLHQELFEEGLVK